MGFSLYNAHVIQREKLMPNKRLLTTEELADYLGSTVGSIYVLKCKGKIPSEWIVNIGRALRFDKEAVDKSINKAKENKNGNLLEGHA